MSNTSNELHDFVLRLSPWYCRVVSTGFRVVVQCIIMLHNDGYQSSKYYYHSLSEASLYSSNDELELRSNKKDIVPPGTSLTLIGGRLIAMILLRSTASRRDCEVECALD